MKYSASTSTFMTESSHGSGITTNMRNSTPTPPRPRPSRSRRRASMGALVLVENDDNAMQSRPVSPGVTRYKNKDQDRFPIPHPPPRRSSSFILRNTPPPPPPPRRRTIGNGVLRQDQYGHNRVSLNCSATLLSNKNNVNAPANNAIATATVSRKCDNNRSSILNATNQPQLLRYHSRNNKNHPVSAMGYIDPYGDSGLYSGEVDDESRPHGKGKMKYDNGIFYEGNWIHGSKDETQGDASGVQTNVTRERILSGFTSWKGQRQKNNDGSNSNGITFVYGMDWADHAGMSGKFTGQVNANDEPDGKGSMKYDFGLIAEGEWIKGKLNGGNSMGGGVTTPQEVAGGGTSVAPGMSVTGGAGTVVSGLGMMSIGGGGGGGLAMGCYPPRIGHGPPPPSGYSSMNAIMPAAPLVPAMYYNPDGTMIGGGVPPMSYQQQWYGKL
eukprot:CAMPEP_0201635470 /NCGR_PEP_ID=MMETSP0493-20130528/7991_1 /ASSEMBLY_ACC=CAM_ASM_000838 /TAXON_ID=420259 /ORGANISM="Thalassiosira gravida, Strain GMp14c1" /LENGTH=439 /DNA_ID=CAMNT_0048107439 /DNA_START=267 /DNA_END=1586 /DNA_ORIENTATION=+